MTTPLFTAGGDNEERTLLLRDDCPVRVGEVESDPGEEEIVLLPSVGRSVCV